jgi:hypothetical protein
MSKNNVLVETRKAFADYKYSEGCSCCRRIEAHKEAEKRLARLLRVPMYKDRSGYDFEKFKTPETK